MSEIVYKLFFFIMLMMFFSFGFLIKVKLSYWTKYHGLDFVSINKDYSISTGGVDYQTKNIVYVKTIPSVCIYDKNNIKCLSFLKSEGGVYNGLAFFTGSNTYK